LVLALGIPGKKMVNKAGMRESVPWEICYGFAHEWETHRQSRLGFSEEVLISPGQKMEVSASPSRFVVDYGNSGSTAKK